MESTNQNPTKHILHEIKSITETLKDDTTQIKNDLSYIKLKIDNQFFIKTKEDTWFLP